MIDNFLLVCAGLVDDDTTSATSKTQWCAIVVPASWPVENRSLGLPKGAKIVCEGTPARAIIDAALASYPIAKLKKPLHSSDDSDDSDDSSKKESAAAMDKTEDETGDKDQGRWEIQDHGPLAFLTHRFHQSATDTDSNCNSNSNSNNDAAVLVTFPAPTHGDGGTGDTGNGDRRPFLVTPVLNDPTVTFTSASESIALPGRAEPWALEDVPLLPVRLLSIGAARDTGGKCPAEAMDNLRRRHASGTFTEVEVPAHPDDAAVFQAVASAVAAGKGQWRPARGTVRMRSWVGPRDPRAAAIEVAATSQ